MKDVKKSKLLTEQFNEELQLNQFRYKNESELLTNKGYLPNHISCLLSGSLPMLTVWKLLDCHDTLSAYGFTHTELTRIAQYRYGWKTLNILFRHYNDLWAYGLMQHDVSMLAGHLYGWLSIYSVLKYFVNTPPTYHSRPEILSLVMKYGATSCLEALRYSAHPLAPHLLLPPIQKPSLLTQMLQQEAKRALDRYQGLKNELLAKGYGEDMFTQQTASLVSLWRLLACHESFIAMGFNHRDLAEVAFHPQGWKTLGELQKRYDDFIERGFVHGEIVILSGHDEGWLSLQYIAKLISQRLAPFTRKQVDELVDRFSPSRVPHPAIAIKQGIKRKRGSKSDAIEAPLSVQPLVPLFFKSRRHSIPNTSVTELDSYESKQVMPRPASTH